MMTALGNKKNVKIFSFALAGVFIASVGIMAIVSMGDTANAAPTSDIGVVDQRQVISDNGTLALDYQKKLKETADEMQKDFDANSINAVKSSLMGPLAGIGDSIFWGVLRVIAAGIAVGLGASGNVLAPIVFLLLFNIPSILVKYYGTFLGYKLGSEYIQKVYASGLMNILTKAASIVGLIMVGGMTASMVTFNSTYELTMKGESVLNLQNMLDQIFIGIVPLGLTLLCYYLLKKKNVSITVLIIGVIILSILLSLLGIA